MANPQRGLPRILRPLRWAPGTLHTTLKKNGWWTIINSKSGYANIEGLFVFHLQLSLYIGAKQLCWSSHKNSSLSWFNNKSWQQHAAFLCLLFICHSLKCEFFSLKKREAQPLILHITDEQLIPIDGILMGEIDGVRCGKPHEGPSSLRGQPSQRNGLKLFVSMIECVLKRQKGFN